MKFAGPLRKEVAREQLEQYLAVEVSPPCLPWFAPASSNPYWARGSPGFEGSESDRWTPHPVYA